jgi:hypothetical protein
MGAEHATAIRAHAATLANVDFFMISLVLFFAKVHPFLHLAK